MKNKIIKILVGILILAILILGTLCVIDHIRMKNNEDVLFSTWGKKYSAPLKESKKTNVVLSLHDEISKNSVWCGTFQLIWNDLKNDIAKQDIIFTPQLQIAENLNKGTFTSNDISEESYYKVYGTPTIELKKKIGNAIKDKFNETSDILDNFEWNGSETNGNNYFLYSMIKKEFEFEKKFTELESGKFGEYNGVEYFGICEDTEYEVRNQVKVLYYNSKENFAIKLLTKQNDEVIIVKGAKENNFYDIYQSVMKQKEEYKGEIYFNEKDKLKIPNIQFKVKEEFEELEGQEFKLWNEESYQITNALQTIEFELDKAGGKVKSEAGLGLTNSCIDLTKEPREFIVDDSFTIFLQEREKSLPYLAARVDDISKFQINNEELKKDETAEKSDKLVAMYKTIIDHLVENNNATYPTDKYISLDVESLRAPAKEGKTEYLKLTEDEKEELLQYCKKYNKEVKSLSMDELKEQGYNKGDETFITLEGALFRILEIEKLEENKAVIWFQSFHTGLGAVMPKYELKYKNGEWEIKVKERAVS